MRRDSGRRREKGTKGSRLAYSEGFVLRCGPAIGHGHSTLPLPSRPALGSKYVPASVPDRAVVVFPRNGAGPGCCQSLLHPRRETRHWHLGFQRILTDIASRAATNHHVSATTDPLRGNAMLTKGKWAGETDIRVGNIVLSPKREDG
jgi:hypothetical protein